MNWGFPAAVYFATALLPVVAIFLYRRRARIVVVPALQVWEILGRPVAVRSFRALLRRLFSLVVQAVIVILLVTALGDPNPQAVTARRLVLIIDASGTMQTRESNRTRLELAKQKALDLLDRTGTGSEVAVVEAAATPLLLVAPTSDYDTVRQAVAGIRSRAVDADLPATIRAANGYAGDGTVPTAVYCISDFAGENLSTLRGLWTAKSQLMLVPVGSPRPDAAITALHVETVGDLSKVVVTLSQSGMDGRLTCLRLERDGRTVASEDVSFSMPSRTVELRAPLPQGSRFTLTLDSGDDLAVDDHAFGVADRPLARRILLITNGNRPLDLALRANPAATILVQKPGAPWHAGDFEAIVLDSSEVPAQQTPKGREGYLFVGAPDPFGWSAIRRWVDCRGITYWQGSHRTTLDLDLSILNVPQLASLHWGSALRLKSLASAEDAPAIVEAIVPGCSGRYLYWLFDVRRSDLPRRVTFPVLLWNTLDYLTRADEEPPAMQRTGPSLTLPALGPEPPAVVAPDGRRVIAMRTSSGYAAHGVDQQGFYEVRAGPERRTYALNWLSRRGIAPLNRHDSWESGAITAESSSSAGAASTFRLSWRSVLVAALAIVLVEWLLYHRRAVEIA